MVSLPHFAAAATLLLLLLPTFALSSTASSSARALVATVSSSSAAAGTSDGEVHITQLRVTPSEPGSSTVQYGTAAHELRHPAVGKVTKIDMDAVQRYEAPAPAPALPGAEGVDGGPSLASFHFHFNGISGSNLGTVLVLVLGILVILFIFFVIFWFIARAMRARTPPQQ